MKIYCKYVFLIYRLEFLIYLKYQFYKYNIYICQEQMNLGQRIYNFKIYFQIINKFIRYQCVKLVGFKISLNRIVVGRDMIN